jgi:sec-independent protein translocase protein TatB
MADLKKSFDDIKEAATGFTSNNVMTSLQKDVGDALNIADIDKPPPEAPATPAIDPPDMPTTPEAPVAETFTEAETHAAATEPLAITSEVQAEPALGHSTPPMADDGLKDAKAS